MSEQRTEILNTLAHAGARRVGFANRAERWLLDGRYISVPDDGGMDKRAWGNVTALVKATIAQMERRRGESPDRPEDRPRAPRVLTPTEPEPESPPPVLVEALQDAREQLNDLRAEAGTEVDAVTATTEEGGMATKRLQCRYCGFKIKPGRFERVGLGSHERHCPKNPEAPLIQRKGETRKEFRQRMAAAGIQSDRISVPGMAGSLRVIDPDLAAQRVTAKERRARMPHTVNGAGPVGREIIAGLDQLLALLQQGVEIIEAQRTRAAAVETELRLVKEERDAFAQRWGAVQSLMSDNKVAKIHGV